MSGRTAVGIDLGTTNSCVGVLRNGKVEIIQDDFGYRVIPSCVAFTEKETLVGESAKLHAREDPENTVYEVKRLIGCRYDQKNIQEKMKSWSFQVINSNGNPKVAVNYLGQRKELTPEEISAMILRKMKTIAETFTDDTITDAVITIPAHFKDSQRQATLDAGKIAGLDVLKIINEPTAAAIAYGINRNFKKRRNVLVFDLGGGTFDVAILAIENGKFDVLSVNGDTFLGGADFTNRLVEFFCEEFERKNGIDISDNSRARAKLRVESEKIKCQLSVKVQQDVLVEDVITGHNFRTTIRRSRFEDLCSDLFESVLDPVKEALEDSGLAKHQIHDIVLAGGSTRVPRIQELLSKFFDGRDLKQTINPDEAIAYGATIHAASLAGDPDVGSLVFSDVIPLSLGIEVIGDRMSFIVKKNTKYPVTNSKEYTTTCDNQTKIGIKVYEGEKTTASENNLLGEFTIKGIEKASAGVPKIDVTFKIDEHCILDVTARDKKTKANDSITITSSKGRLGEQDIDRMLLDQSQYQEQERRQNHYSEAANELEEFCQNKKEGTEKKLKKGKVFKKDAQKIIKACDDALHWVRSTFDATDEMYENRKKELEEFCDDFE